MNRILLVDDGERILEFTSIALRNHHYEVVTAANGQLDLDDQSSFQI